MKVFKVFLKDRSAVGVVLKNGKVSIAHPAVGKVLGKSEEQLKKHCKEKKLKIKKIR